MHKYLRSIKGIRAINFNASIFLIFNIYFNFFRYHTIIHPLVFIHLNKTFNKFNKNKFKFNSHKYSCLHKKYFTGLFH